MNKKVALGFIFYIFYFSISAAQSSMELNAGETKFSLKSKTAKWIGCLTPLDREEYVVDFVLDYQLAENPKTFIIHLSANNRYIFYVNGKYVCESEQLLESHSRRYETIDIASFLTKGNNVLHARLVHPDPFIENRISNSDIAFFLQGYSKIEQSINTGTAPWKYKIANSFKPISFRYRIPKAIHNAYSVNHVTDSIFLKYDRPFGLLNGLVDSSYQLAVVTDTLKNVTDKNIHSFLIPRKTPLIKRFPSQTGTLMRSSGIYAANSTKLPVFPIVVPPKKNITLLIDFKKLNVAYPTYIFNKGKNSKVKITYSEAPQTQNAFRSNRNEIRNREFRGMYDVVLPAGKTNQSIVPSSSRTFRYLFIEIETKDDTLVFENPTMQPFYSEWEQQSFFKCDNDTLNSIFNTAMHTSRLCAQNSYWSDAYYEHIQYFPYARIQALTDLYIKGNDFMYREVLEQYHNSRNPNGLVVSLNSKFDTIIQPILSLYWIDMLESYLYWKLDTPWLKQFEKGIIQSLEWHKCKLNNQDGLLMQDGSNFIDFSEKNINHSILLNLHFSYSLKNACSILRIIGNQAKAEEYLLLSRKIAISVYNQCFDAVKGIVANDVQKNSFSQQVNIMAVLANAVPQAYYNELISKIIHNKQLDEASLYYKFYLFEAILKSQNTALYTRELSEWKSMIQLGMTSFTGIVTNPYTDCQAYSVSPAYHFFTIVSGIQAKEYGFKKIVIQPELIGIKKIETRFAHPNGFIEMRCKKSGAMGLKGSIIIPANTEVILMYGNKEQKLKQGKNKINIKQ